MRRMYNWMKEDNNDPEEYCKSLIMNESKYFKRKVKLYITLPMMSVNVDLKELLEKWDTGSEAYKACFPRLGVRFEFPEGTDEAI